MSDTEISSKTKVKFFQLLKIKQTFPYSLSLGFPLQLLKKCSDMSDIQISLGTKVLFQQNLKNRSDMGDTEISYKQTFPYSLSLGFSLQLLKKCSDISDIEISLKSKVLFQQHLKNRSDMGDIEFPYYQTFIYSLSLPCSF